MQWKRWRYLVAAAALPIVGLFGATAPSTAAIPGSKASGHGFYEVDGAKRQFSFTAVTHRDGTVTGQAQLQSGDYQAHFEVSCLLVVGNRASVGGTVKSSNDPEFQAEYPFAFFTVYDNGEPGAGADTISPVYYDTTATPDSCQNIGDNDFAQTPIEGGNIQVKMVDTAGE